MAGGLFALLDDIATILDDVGVMTKVAAKKTAGVLGDDLAVNAYQVGGMSPDRELPVVWAVAKGSLLNKLILVPSALLLSFFFPAAIDYVLLIGGAYLGFEGAEKIWEWLFHHQEKEEITPNDIKDLSDTEKMKIKGAIKTDFILSAEIVIIALGVLTEMNKTLFEQVIALSFVAIALTFGVYGMVALIVKLDDIGKYWVTKHKGLLDLIGRFLLWFAPRLLKSLTVIGTIAMFAVAGTIWVEHLPPLEYFLAPTLFMVQTYLGHIGIYLVEIMVGSIIGFLVLMIWNFLGYFRD
ncbi:DUF808 domain-containing protein [Suttonella ornithocola]|uniref:Inner membrane protein yedI n=1 Tax=Suttonella ornithocola TaxID=279832 RepID=A0A380MRL2_9GAMM|nr:DUF808 domain-containing protein [Suttonella ornithocola]SUO94928.1 Inner membrane protein yedI [Suttonella ornithocola]